MRINEAGSGLKLLGPDGRPIEENGPANLKPGVVIVHCVMEPDTGAIQMHRSERNPPPTSAQAYKVEIDNWFTLLTNCIAILIHKISNEMGVPRGMLLETMNRTITTYFEDGGTGGHRKKIVVNTDKKEVTVEDKRDEPTIKMDYDSEVLSCGFSSLLGSETYVEYCGRVGKSDRDKNKIPYASEFYNAIVFRKEVIAGDKKYYLEVARDKVFTPSPDDAKFSKYLVAMVIDTENLGRKIYWQITAPEQTTELLKTIEEEASKIIAIL